MASVLVKSVLSATKRASLVAVLRMVTVETLFASAVVVELAMGAIPIATYGLGACVDVYKVWRCLHW